jgi:hypothetical protein
VALTEPTSAGAHRAPSVDPSPAKTADRDSGSVKDTVVDLKDLVLAYAKQETVDPLKALGRFVAFGVVGAILLAVGTVLGSLAIVRAIQTETAPHLTGNLSWVPYVGGILFGLIVAVAAITRIGKTK